MDRVAEAIDADTLRIRHEFLTLPGLRTRIDACAQFLSVSPRRAERILESLVRDGFLERTSDGQYARRPGVSPVEARRRRART